MSKEIKSVKRAIEYLRSKGIDVDDAGNIVSVLPEGLDGIYLVDELERLTMKDGYCFTIINSKLEKIEI